MDTKLANILLALLAVESAFAEQPLLGEGSACIGLVVADIAQLRENGFSKTMLGGFQSGVLVLRVPENGPAAATDIEAGDILYSFNHQQVHNRSHLILYIRETQPGSKFVAVAFRKGEQIDMAGVLGKQIDNRCRILDPLATKS